MGVGEVIKQREDIKLWTPWGQDNIWTYNGNQVLWLDQLKLNHIAKPIQAATIKYYRQTPANL